MSDDEKRELIGLIERGDRYGLMLAAVRLWADEYHRGGSHTAVYAFHEGDSPPTRVTVPASASSAPAR